MFPENRLDERTPQFLDGYYGAEVDHEDGAQVYVMLIRAESELQRKGLSYSERQRLQGRVVYCREILLTR